MSAMTSFTLRSLSKNRARTLVTIAGVALAAALLTAVAASVTSLNEFLLNSEKADNGIWTARTWTHVDAIDAARADEAVDDALVTRDVGSYAFDEGDRRMFGRLLSVISLEGDTTEMTGFKTSEGRLPETPDEIVLPKSLEGTDVLGGGALELGATTTFELGQRVAHLRDGADASEDPYARPKRTDVADYQVYSGGIDQKVVADGDVLNSCDAYRSADEEGAAFFETIENATPRTYTVVGFYESRNLLTWTPNGCLAFTGADPSAAGPTRLYVSTSAFDNMADMEDHLKSTLGDTFLDYHSTLLRYAGVTDDRAAWSTLYRFAAVLAAVIMATCVSLIYNAFAISIAERTRQFGLLSSIGASKRQIRGAVVFEALLIAALGVPLGIAFGIGGTALVLGTLAPSIEKVAGSAGDVAFTLFVNPASIAVVVVLTLATVLASVWLPARRAGSVCAIEAIKNTRETREVKLSRTDVRAADEPWANRGIGLHRAFGVPGLMARANRKRGRGKGRAASISLGLAVILLITAGSATMYLTLGTRYIGSNDYDISAHFMSEGGLSEQTCASAYSRMDGIEGVDGKGWSMREDLLAYVPNEITGTGVSETESDLRGLPVVNENGRWRLHLSLTFVEDEAFSSWARENGIDPKPFFAGEAAGIGIRNVYGNDGTAYRYDEAFDGTGDISVLATASYLGAAYEGVLYDGETVQAVFAHEDGGTLKADVSEVEDQMNEVRILALADESPTSAPSSSYQPTVILPISALEGLGIAGTLTDCTAVFSAEDHAAAAEQMIEIGEEMRAAHDPDADNLYVDVYDIAESEESSQMLVTIIDIFSAMFTGILMLIAMTNVFNTLTNGLILRKREFAVMRSIGMGARDFRKMTACECIGFGVRGLIPGVIISAGVSYLLFLSFAGTIEGLTFSLPLDRIALAVLMVLAVMAASVAYGLRRCRTDSIADALKSDIA